MSLFKYVNLAHRALAIEDELELSYLFGKKLADIRYMKLREPRLKGVFLRTIFILVKNMKKVSLVKEKPYQCGMLFYADSLNQFDSMVSTMEEVQNLDFSCCLLYENFGLRGRLPSLARRVRINLIDFLSFFLILVPRGWVLFHRLKSEHRRKELRYYFHYFLEVHLYIPFFIRYLSECQPNLVIVANDHTGPCRSLRLACQILDVKIAYMQHASVSPLFPPLEYDFALLDGRVAYQTYCRCYDAAEASTRVTLNAAKCKVFLTGQKKPVRISTGSIDAELAPMNCFGLAVNALDELPFVLSCLKLFEGEGWYCVIRTHPGQSQEFIKGLTTFIADKPCFSWSDPAVEVISEFLSRTNVLIAGNSSIHLEAALHGNPCIYYEMSTTVLLPDYYGYVANGLVQHVNSESELVASMAALSRQNRDGRARALKCYSETYLTKHQGNEGRLNAEVFARVLSGRDLTDLMSREASDAYEAVYTII